MSSRWPFLTFLLLICILAIPLLATGPTGMITGTVTDPAGAVIVKAKVTVRNEGTNAIREVQTNDDGDYTVALLTPGTYTVTVEHKGFRESVSSGVVLDVDQTMRVDFALQVGVPNEVVKVTETPPIVQTDTSEQGQVLEPDQVHNLPLNERNFLNFALLIPGGHAPVAGSENSTEGGAISVNGAREQSNNFLLNGVDNNDPYINQYTVLPSVDAIQEFKVQEGNYSAEFGRAGGAQVNVILKSGTNQFHGTLFEYLRNRTLDAKNAFDRPDCTPTSVPGTCGPIPRFDRNQFGGTLGGPIVKDKTFFFVSYEGLRMRQATTRTAVVPSQVDWAQAEGLAAALNGLGIPNNPSGAAIQALYPQANVGSNLATSNLYVAAPVIRNREDLFSAKFDHHAGSGATLSFHYSLYNVDRFNPIDPVNAFTSLPGYGSNQKVAGQNAGVTWTHIVKSNMANEFRAGVNRIRVAYFQQSKGTDFNQMLGFPNGLTNSVDLGYPDISLNGYDGIGEPINYPQDRYDTTIQGADNLSWTSGKHQLKIGGDVRIIRLNDYIDYTARGNWSFTGSTVAGVLGGVDAMANYMPMGPCDAGALGGPNFPMQTCILSSLLLGLPDDAVLPSGTTNNTLKSTGYSAYIQDDIHVIPRFLLNVGLRYDYNTPPVESHNRFTVPDLSSNSATCMNVPDCQFIQAGTNGIPKATFNPSTKEFGPRIGFAWRPLKSERWVVRGGYGVFFDSGIFQFSVLPRANPPNYTINIFQNVALEPLQCLVPAANQPPFCPVALPSSLGLVEMISPNFKNAYMQQWNLDLQYEVGPNWMIDLAYIGSKGTHLADVIDRNQFNIGTGQYPYPQFGAVFLPIPPFPQVSAASILQAESNASSNYHALQFRTERRMSHGLEFLASYTFSKSLDDMSSIFGGSAGSGLPQDSTNLRADRGPSDFDARHRVVINALYNLPFERLVSKDAHALRGLLGGWQIGGIFTVQSGTPFTVVCTSPSACGLPDTTFGAADQAFGYPFRPDLVGDPFKGGQVAANPTCTAPTQVRTAQNWFNPCAFAVPAGGFGTEGRNALTGPTYIDMDFSISKSIPLHSGGHHLQFRGEVFNLFNHPNLDGPRHAFNFTSGPNNTIVPAGSFSSITSANAYGQTPPRQIQVAVRYSF